MAIIKKLHTENDFNNAVVPADKALVIVSKEDEVPVIKVKTETSWTTLGKEGPKGEPGDVGASGATYTPTVDAEGNLSFTNSITQEVIAVGNIKGPQGEPGKDGTMSFEDLTDAQKETLKGEPGPPGEDGYTPVRGVDYYTNDDQAALIDEVLSKLPYYEFHEY